MGRIKAKAKDLSQLFDYFSADQELQVTYFRGSLLHTATLVRDSNYTTPLYQLLPLENPKPHQLKNRKAWMQVN